MKHMRTPREVADKIRRSGRCTLRQRSIAFQQMERGEVFKIIPTDDGRDLPAFDVRFERLDGLDLYAVPVKK